MVMWTFQTACYLSLLIILADYDEFDEIRRVECFVNSLSPRGTTDLVKKVPFRSGEDVKVATRKLSKKLGRAHELKQKILREAKAPAINDPA